MDANLDGAHALACASGPRAGLARLPRVPAAGRRHRARRVDPCSIRRAPGLEGGDRFMGRSGISHTARLRDRSAVVRLRDLGRARAIRIVPPSPSWLGLGAVIDANLLAAAVARGLAGAVTVFA